MRRSSMKQRAVTEHRTEPNIVITIVFIGRGLLSRLSVHYNLTRAQLQRNNTARVLIIRERRLHWLNKGRPFVYLT